MYIVYIYIYTAELILDTNSFYLLQPANQMNLQPRHLPDRGTKHHWCIGPLASDPRRSRIPGFKAHLNHPQKVKDHLYLKTEVKTPLQPPITSKLPRFFPCFSINKKLPKLPSVILKHGALHPLHRAGHLIRLHRARRCHDLPGGPGVVALPALQAQGATGVVHVRVGSTTTEEVDATS